MDECNRCGECCTHIAIGMVKDVRKVAKDYLKARGVIFKDGFILIPFVCPHLHVMGHEPWEIDPGFNEESRTYYCDIHNHKPAICKEWNGRKTVRGFPTYVPDCCSMKVRP